MNIPLNILNANNPTTQTSRRYWHNPSRNPIYNVQTYEYLDVNKDVKLRKEITDFFHSKILKWISEDIKLSKYKSKINSINSMEGKMIVYKLLRHFIHKSGINWYDLRDNYDIIKEYLVKKLNSI